MKKKLAFLLAMVLMFTAVLTGCGGETTSSVKLEDNEEEYHIKWFAPGKKYPDHELVFEEMSKLTKERINATVSQTLIPSAEYRESIERMIFAGEPIDALFASGFPNLVADGIYAPLDDLIDQYGKDMKAVLGDYVWKAVSVNNTIYAFPPLKDHAVHYVFQYFDGLVEKYNMDFSTVKELKDIEPMLQTIKDNEPGVYPLGIIGRGDSLSIFLPIEKVRGATIAGWRFDDYDTVVNFYETQEFKEYFDLMRRWNQKGFMRPDAATSGTVTDLINAHKIFLLTSETLPYFEEELHRTEDEGWKTIFDGRLTQPTIDTRSVSQACIAIAANSENPVRTMKFFNLLYKDADLMNMVVYGIEGKHYTVDEDKVHVKLPEGVPSFSKGDYYGTPSYQGNRWLLYVEPGIPGDIWEKYQEFDANAYISPSYGFHFNSEPVQNELTAINNVYAEYIPSLMVGDTDPAVKLPEALEKFRVAGSETVIAEIQKQYDAWKAITK